MLHEKYNSENKYLDESSQLKCDHLEQRIQEHDNIKIAEKLHQRSSFFNIYMLHDKFENYKSKNRYLMDLHQTNDEKLQSMNS